MNKKVFFFLVLVTSFFFVKAQSPAEQLAGKIANKMKDTLSLSTQQRNSIYDINMNLSNQKAAVRYQYTAPDSLTIKIQLVERSRDSLYSGVLSAPQFQLYKQKKRNLVSNN